MITPGWLCQG